MLKRIGSTACCALFILSCNSDQTIIKSVSIDSNVTMFYEYQGNRLLSEKKVMVSNNDTGGYIKKFYPDGQLAKFQYFYNNRFTGNQIEYDANGKETSVTILQSDGSKLFYLVLNKRGQPIEQFGIPIHIIHKANPFKVGEVINIVYEIIVTNNLKTALQIRSINPKGTEIYNQTFSNFVPEKKEAHIERVRYEKPGQYLRIIDVKLSNTDGVVLSKGQIIDTFMVVEQ